MRKFIIGAALAASTLTAAVPAAAQWAPQPQPYGYNNGYNQGQGRGHGRMLAARIDQVRQQIRVLDRQNLLSNREASRLDQEAQQLQFRVRNRAFDGINRDERFDIERRIARLEQRVARNANDGNGRYDRHGYDGRRY